jgi:integrase
VPVFFRLLFSSGMRTTEGRLLKREDVNLRTGVISIRHTKGYNEHMAVLHETMLSLLVQYDSVICRLLPDRQFFFPAVHDKCHWNQWVSDCFREMWFKYNTAKTVPYALRHNYAVENINKWTDTGYEVHDKLVSLSRSMGHSTLQNTLYYYCLVPRLYKTVEDLSGDTYNHLIPDLPDEED